MALVSSRGDVAGARRARSEGSGTAEKRRGKREGRAIVGNATPLALFEGPWFNHTHLSEALWMDMVCEELCDNGKRACKHDRFRCEEGLKRAFRDLTVDTFFVHIGAHGKPGELAVCEPDPGQKYDDQAYVTTDELAAMTAEVNIGPRSIRGLFIGACSYFARDPEDIARKLFVDHKIVDATLGDESSTIAQSELHWVAGFAHDVEWGEGAIVAMAFWRQVILQRIAEDTRKGLRRPGPKAQYLEKAVAVLHQQMAGLLEHVGLCVYRNHRGKPVPVLVRGELPRNSP